MWLKWMLRRRRMGRNQNNRVMIGVDRRPLVFALNTRLKDYLYRGRKLYPQAFWYRCCR